MVGLVVVPPSAGFEYRSRRRIAGVPLVHIVRGADPATGKRPPAIGIIAIGQVATGVIAIGQLAFGLISVGQLSVGALAGVGQVTFALVALGQIAGGALGSLGQAALGPHAFGILEIQATPWLFVWSLASVAFAVVLAVRHRRLANLLALARGEPTPLGKLVDGLNWTRGRIVSDNHLHTPLSNAPCVHWEALKAGPGLRSHECGGDALVIADDTGVARIALAGAEVTIRNGTFSRWAAPDWTLQMESFLTAGEEVHVIGAATAEPCPEAEGLYRGVALMPVFRASDGVPLLVSTDPPDRLEATRRFTTSLAAVLVAVSVTAAAFAPLWAG